MAWYRITGPKGRVIVRRATSIRVKAIAAALRRRFGRITVTRIPRTEAEVRVRIALFARQGIFNESLIHYTMTAQRDDWLASKPTKLPLPLWTDCSGFATLCYYLAGAPDPNGLNYKAVGYTGTMLTHGVRTSQRDAKPGDLVVFGPGTGHHVCIVLQAGDDPLLCSHGQEAGPLRIFYSEEQAHQPLPATWLTYFPKEDSL